MIRLSNRFGLTALSATVVTLLSGQASALPFSSMDPRALGMGGVGVATADVTTATAYNPAMLSVTPEGERLGFTFPYLGVGGYGYQDFIDFEDAKYVDNLDASINSASNLDLATAQSATVTNAYNQVAADARKLNTGLADVAADPFGVDVGSGFVVARTSRELGWGVSAGAGGFMAGTIAYRDYADIEKLAEDVETFAECYGVASGVVSSGATVSTASAATVNSVVDCNTRLNNMNYVAGLNDPNPGEVTYDTDQDLDSELFLTGVVLVEVGVSLATERVISGQSYGFGVTPKMVSATVFEYNANVNTSDSDDATGDDYSTDYSNFNLDLGMTTSFAEGWRAGLTIKNLLAQEYNFQNRNPAGVMVDTGRSVEVKPMARAGVAFQRDWYLIALEMDLTTNAAPGTGDDSRQIALGTEFSSSFAKLRLGYKMDTEGSDRNFISAGLGFFDVFDVAVASGKDELAASFKFGYQF
ncbi:MAG: conjugal transfer protein TraF [Gammaproteobacteria bacterium]|nr:conjugal transfer protein TraF [Gammaproteobacteria bacterium]